MPTIKFKGMDEYLNRLEALYVNTDKMVGEAIYKGADIVADETKGALKGLPTDNRSKLKAGEQRSSINEIQKQGLIHSFGIAPLRDDSGFINVKTGFDGYNRLISKNYPIGQPNVMVARALESGTSFMKKNRVITRATNRARKPCEEAMKKSVEESIEKIMK